MVKRVLHAREEGPEGSTLTRLLERRGFSVVEAEGPAETLRIARVSYFPAAVIDLDPSLEEVRMVLASLKGMWPGLYLVLLTAFSRTEKEVSQVVREVDRILEKPIDFGELEHCLGQAFERGRHGPASPDDRRGV